MQIVKINFVDLNTIFQILTKLKKLRVRIWWENRDLHSSFTGHPYYIRESKIRKRAVLNTFLKQIKSKDLTVRLSKLYLMLVVLTYKDWTKKSN